MATFTSSMNPQGCRLPDLVSMVTGNHSILSLGLVDYRKRHQSSPRKLHNESFKYHIDMLMRAANNQC